MAGKSGDKLVLYVDGASRNNPGPSGAGIYISKNDEDIAKKGFFLGKKTNNEAEYLALIIGVFYSLKYLSDGDKLKIYSDSQLLVRQLIGEYKVKKPELRKLFNILNSALEDVSYSVHHVMREKNTIADSLANKGVEDKIKLPESFISFLKRHDKN